MQSPDKRENLVVKTARKFDFLNKAAFIILGICLLIALIQK